MGGIQLWQMFLLWNSFFWLRPMAARRIISADRAGSVFELINFEPGGPLDIFRAGLFLFTAAHGSANRQSK